MDKDSWVTSHEDVSLGNQRGVLGRGNSLEGLGSVYSVPPSFPVLMYVSFNRTERPVQLRRLVLFAGRERGG